MAIVSRFSVDKAASVKKAVKQSLTQRLRHTVGISDDSSSSESDSEEETTSKNSSKKKSKRKDDEDKESTLRGNVTWDKDIPDEDEPKSSSPFTSKRRGRGRSARRTKSTGTDGRNLDLEMGAITPEDRQKSANFTTSGLEQLTPADAVLAKSDAEDVSNPFVHCLTYETDSHPSSCKYWTLLSCPSGL